MEYGILAALFGLLVGLASSFWFTHLRIELLKERVRILEGHMCEMYRRDTARGGRGWG